VFLHHQSAAHAAVGCLAIEPHFTRGRCFEAGDDAKQRGLAAAAWSHDAHELVRVDRDRHVPQRLDLATLAGEGVDDVVARDVTSTPALVRGRVRQLRHRTRAAMVVAFVTRKS
jgi:hypothetical protein